MIFFTTSLPEKNGFEQIQAIPVASMGLIYTVPETNIAPENRPSQKETSIPTHPFSGAILVFGSVSEIFTPTFG